MLEGLGFRNLRCFNEALLAKKLWRLINHLVSFVARILREKNRSLGDTFLSNGKPSSSPFWRSLLTGTDLVERGTRRRVGNGHTIKIWQHKWLYLPNVLPR